MTNLQISEEVLAAYLRGELNAAEAAAVEAWYDASAANRKLLEIGRASCRERV